MINMFYLSPRRSEASIHSIGQWTMPSDEQIDKNLSILQLDEEINLPSPKHRSKGGSHSRPLSKKKRIMSKLVSKINFIPQLRISK